MAIPAKLVKELRERTGAGMMDCKRALVAADGDLERAAEALRKAGQAKADRKASRVAAEGLVVVRADTGGVRYVLLEVNAETDFATKNPHFAAYAETTAAAALRSRPADVERLMQLEVEGQSLEARRQALVTKIGENVSVRRFALLDSDRQVGAYVHNGRIGVLVDVDGGTPELARDLAMQVAATSPRYVSAAQIPEAELAKEREILTAQALQEGKPEPIVQKMVAGRLRKHLDEVTLEGQPFVKDPDQRVRDLLGEADAQVVRFVRYEVGEGIARKADNFVEEVMAQASQSR